MRAGMLNQRITVEQRVGGQDEAGEPFEDWLPYLSAWAAVSPLRGREIVAADAVASITEVRVIIHYRPGITSAMRVQHGTDTYSIESVANIASAGRVIELLCKRVQ